MMTDSGARDGLFNDIKGHLGKGGNVLVATYTKATKYGPKHAEWFSRDARGSIYVKRGKGRDCIDYCAIRFI